MANLANTMEANAAVTLQAVQRFGQPAGNGNGSGKGNANDNGSSSKFQGINQPHRDGQLVAGHGACFTSTACPEQPICRICCLQLAREAQHWWQVECRLLQLQNVDVPWDVFQTAFYKKYFPKSTREAKEMELMQLKQDFLSVADYTSKFEELCRFSRVCQGVPETYESWKCIKYQRGLKDDIMTAVAPMKIRIFSELVNKARVVEEYAKTVASQGTLMEETPIGNVAITFHQGGKALREMGTSERTTMLSFTI
ncbi:uncharacterized protein LOC107615510 [Arachis ipaensis]|uniref:uncharacterized protein LOC107615510 n=1 Tax=Arachis ipaensis TaxID=130454 RepID=UPI0007AFB05B|nr:uncharacterized protein LOC107615510 [Arachis ipaensis]